MKRQLIDRDILLKQIGYKGNGEENLKFKNSSFREGYRDAVMRIRSMISTLSRSVEEAPSAKWVYSKNTRKKHCSNCSLPYPDNEGLPVFAPYCYFCGRKMEE